MADAAKYQLVYNGNSSSSIFTDLKSHVSPFKTRKSKAFVYGILFIFVSFTVFVAFSPSSTSSPWFIDIFSSSSPAHTTPNDTSSSSSSSSVFSDESYRSHFSSIFSYFFPNSSSPAESHSPDPRNSTALPLPTSNSHQYGPQGGILKPNQATHHPPDPPISANVTGNPAPATGTEGKVGKDISAYLSRKPTNSSSDRVSASTAVNKTASLSPPAMQSSTPSPSVAKNMTDHSSSPEKASKTVPDFPPTAIDKTASATPARSNETASGSASTAVNKTASLSPPAMQSSTPSPSVAKNMTDHSSSPEKASKTVPDSPPTAIDKTASATPARSNETASGSSTRASGAQATSIGTAKTVVGEKDLIKLLSNCELYDGDWVRDDSHPLYKPGSCGLIDEQFSCFLNGRPHGDYQKLKWKPKGCIYQG
ncbi:hypothetical protein Dimus_001882 [Dionaea muscipula]